MQAAPDPLHRLLTTFAGVPAGQIWADYYLWELVLNEHVDLNAIVEIGTWEGGFSLYLHTQASLRGMRFRTFDAVTPEKVPPGFAKMDVFAHRDDLVSELQGLEPIALLCDGGNKPREMREFGAALSPPSIVLVHDWLTEMLPHDVPDCLTPIHEEACDMLGSMTRVFQPVR